MNTNELKRQLRKAIKAQKLKLNPELARQKADYILSEIESIDSFRQAKTVLAFWSLPDEIDTHKFVTKWASHKRIVLPVVNGDELELRLFTGLEQMEKTNSFGIMEPKTGLLIKPEEIDFAIIPGVAFDLKGNRLGRGKGYYDRTMPLLKNAVKLGIAYEFQLIGSVPVSEHDVPVDLVISN
ncbi:MAG TPA: 5-formyltetrahydrofolate cyclo-ligase [Bacteroidales bacterium]|nr:5-formyltetrahydrofolate cyclo-ligase [Bacteroidales bacterium]